MLEDRLVREQLLGSDCCFLADKPSTKLCSAKFSQNPSASYTASETRL